MTTTFFVEGIPAPQGSKVPVSRGGRVWLREASSKVKPWREKVKREAQKHFTQPTCEPVLIGTEFVLPRTKAMANKQAPLMTQRPDGDKLTRAVWDALTGVVVDDDSQSVAWWGMKRRAEPGEPAGVRIYVDVMDADSFEAWRARHE